MQIDQATAKEIIRLQPYMHLIQAISEGKEVLLKNHFGENIKANNLGLPVHEYSVLPEVITIKTRRYLWKDVDGYKVFSTDYKTYVLYDVSKHANFVKWIDSDWETFTEVQGN